QLWPRPQIPP
uniref:Bradykinin-potentiating peptide POL-236 n=2 Tax=Crotalinae TaxID=8710 RepID=BPP36_AGKBI|nr:RecName: Full=Bradykinin-potentiating peptide POL-236; Short=BPP POL-236 [Crotalus atrox]